MSQLGRLAEVRNTALWPCLLATLMGLSLLGLFWGGSLASASVAGFSLPAVVAALQA